MKNDPKLPWGVYEGRKLVGQFRTRQEARTFAKRRNNQAPTPRPTRLGILDDRDGVPFFPGMEPLPLTTRRASNE